MLMLLFDLLLLLPSFVQAWENLIVQRAYTIKDALVHEKITIVAKHSNHKPQDSYIFVVPLGELAGHVQGVYAGNNLETSEVGDGEYKIRFPDLVNAGDKRKFEVQLILGRALKAVPSKTNLLEPNAVEFEFSLAPNLSYATASQEISVSGFGRLVSYGPEFMTMHGNVLSGRIPEGGAGRPNGVVHFMHDSHLNFVASAHRSVHVSHFGGVSVLDEFEVKNAAAKLQGEFSRIPFSVREQMGEKSPFKLDGYSEALGAIFSKHAFNIHYFDVVGNISTSTAKRSANDKYIAADLLPRFPLLGGWRTEFSLSHGIPTAKAVNYDADTGKFFLTMPFNHPLVKYFTDSLVFEVLLPEGAYDVEVMAPRKISRDISEYRRDWLDTPIVGGHTVVRFRSSSPFIIPEKEALNFKFTISYRLSYFAHIRPALLLVSYFLGMFALLAGVARLTAGDPLPESSPATPSGGSPTAAGSRASSSPGFVMIQPARPSTETAPSAAAPSQTNGGLKKRKQ